MAKTTKKQLLNEYLTTGFKGYVYRLSCGDDFYIGSTLRNLKKRLQDHKEKYKHGNCKLYQFIRKVGFENMEIEVLEEVKYIDKLDVRKRERYYYDLLKPTLNEIAPYLSPEEKKIKAHLKWKKWYYTPSKHDAQKKKKIEDYHNKYRDYLTEKVDCECGRRVCRKYLKEHKKSNIHRDLILNQEIGDFQTDMIQDEIDKLEENFLQPKVELLTRIECDELEEVNLDELCI